MCATFGQSPAHRLGLRDKSVALEFDIYCAVLVRDWEGERELERLKSAIAWAFGAEEKGPSRRVCKHERFAPAEGGGVRCVDCGEAGY